MTKKTKPIIPDFSSPLWRPTPGKGGKKKVEEAKVYTYIPHFDKGPPSPPSVPAVVPKTKVEEAKVYTYIPHFDKTPKHPKLPPPAMHQKEKVEKAKVYTYIPHFDKKQSSPKAVPTEKTPDYYIYDGPYAGRLTSALTYQQSQPCTVQAYGIHQTVPGSKIPAPQAQQMIAMVPYGFPIQQPPNVPAEYLATYYAEHPGIAPVMYTYVPAVAVPVKATPKPAAATASVPSSSTPWYGPTANEVDMQNRVIMDDQMKARQLKGHVPSASDQYWCRELDGLYTVRTAIDIYESCTPGYWTTGEGNYPYFVREEANS